MASLDLSFKGRTNVVAIPGATFRLDSTGRAIPVSPDNGGLADGLIQVTGVVPADPGVVILALNQGGAVPLPISGKYTCNFQALQAAVAAGTRLILTPA